MKLTIEKRNNVAKREADKKFDKNIKESLALVGSYLETLVKKKARVFDKELIDSGYILMSRAVQLDLPKELHRTKCPYPNSNYTNIIRNHHFEMEEEYATKPYSGVFTFNTDKKTEKMIKDYHKLLDDKNAFEKELITLLNSFTTVKQLLDHVPEMEGYFPPDKKVSTDLVPMELVKKMRKHFKQSSINITAETPSTELAQLH